MEGCWDGRGCRRGRGGDIITSFHTGSSNESLAATTKAARRQGCQLRSVSVKRVSATARCT